MGKLDFCKYFEELSIIGYVVHALDGSIVHHNQAALEILGLTEDQLLGKTPMSPHWECFDEDGSPFPGEQHPASITLQTQEPCFDVMMLVKTEHNIHGSWIKINSRPIIEDDQMVNVAVFFSFESEFKQLQNELKLISGMKELYSDLVLKNNIVAITDAAGDIVEVNDKFCEISGYSRKELIGKNHRILNSGFHDLSFFEEMWVVIRSGQQWQGRIKNRRKDGTYYWVDTIIALLFDDKHNITNYIAVRKDITNEIESYDVDLKTARLASVGETTAQIIHDVMNPLTTIGFTSSLLKRVDKADTKATNEAIEKACQKLDDSVNTIQMIFNEMRSMVLDDSRVTKFKAKDLLELSVETVSHHLNKHDIKWDVEILENFETQANMNQLKQVLVNLIRNAIDAIKNNDEKWVKISAGVINKFYFFKVKDSGDGIDIAIQDKVFESLYTTKTDSGGTGLGLSICKKIVEAHGGRIYINNESTNTEFVILLNRSNPYLQE
jgi:PAS domain S-box-containing protein